MSASPHFANATACCAFCGKSLVTENAQMQPWRAPDGQLFCNEFCADDAEEARFQRHGRSERDAGERAPPNPTR